MRNADQPRSGGDKLCDAINVFLSYSPKIAKSMRLIMIASGILLIVFGILLLTDKIRVLGNLLPSFGLKL